MMQDPHPSNIVGEKSVSHVVEHRVRWDYLALAVAGLYLAWKLGKMVSTSGGGEEIEIEDGETEEKAQVAGLRTEV